MAGTDLTPEGRDEMSRPKGFDDYEVRLGDLLRGERATLGKSLMDVQRNCASMRTIFQRLKTVIMAPLKRLVLCRVLYAHMHDI